MNVVITGVSGLIGRHLATDLEAHGHAVIGADRAPPTEPAGRFVGADLTSMAQIERAMADADAMVHLARVPFPYASNGYDAATRTWRKPDHAGDAEKFNLNLAMTYNALAAARAAGVRKIVVGSSFAVYGLYYPSRPLMPDYLPIDEDHPRRPDDAYGLTKLIGEQLADAFVSTGTMQIASLRFPGVSREDPQTIAARQSDPMARGIGGLWTYVDARDAATACRLALEADFGGHQAFNICAPTTFMKTPTDDLVRRYVADIPRVTKNLADTWAGYDTSKAARLLGFKAKHLFSV